MKARQQAEKVAQKKANKIKQKIVNKEKQPSSNEKKAEDQKILGRGALQRQKKRARKEAGEDNIDQAKDAFVPPSKKSDDKIVTTKEKKLKMAKPQKKRKINKDEDALEDMIRSYKSSFSGGVLADKEALADVRSAAEPKIKSSDMALKKRWFE